MPDKFFALAGLVVRLFKIIAYVVVCVGGGGKDIMLFLFLFSSVVRKIKYHKILSSKTKIN